MIRTFAHAIIRLLTIACFLGLAGQAFAKNCPRASPTEFSVASRTRTLDGRLVFHNGVRQWFELKLDKPACGERSIQLITADLKSAALEILRGCRVRSRGSIDFSPTGYYSLDKFQDVTNIVAVGKCVD